MSVNKEHQGELILRLLCRRNLDFSSDPRGRAEGLETPVPPFRATLGVVVSSCSVLSLRSQSLWRSGTPRCCGLRSPAPRAQLQTCARGCVWCALFGRKSAAAAGLWTTL
ncbi:hypothetical protein OJAV_G00210180 [Oryzias javanicus]|uniref:Uncharacterized protein n=1 Tax=Oryzias javanicus TaxID=123683 RepID=A0A3S2TYH5_ORYJA|nr:hypothetical protein OJAV_G00210180 [Oryzias javanicus]